jgi:hypothetical protein
VWFSVGSRRGVLTTQTRFAPGQSRLLAHFEVLGYSDQCFIFCILIHFILTLANPEDILGRLKGCGKRARSNQVEWRQIQVYYFKDFDRSAD